MRRNNRFVDVATLSAISESENSDLVDSFIRVFDLGYNDRKRIPVIDHKELKEYCRALNTLELTKWASQGYFLGTKVPNIDKQFDLLRFTKKQVFNLEVKSKLPKGGLPALCKQIKRNRYYLSVLTVDSLIVEYVIAENQFYTLRNEKLVKINSDSVKSMIDVSEPLEKNPILDLDGSVFLLSPINNADRFFEDQYFLNLDQEAIVKKILESKCDYLISGGPGSGKTLVIFDLAKRLMQENKEVVVVFSGKVTEKHREFSEITGIKIISAKDFIGGNYDVVIVDEAQRLYQNSFDIIVSSSGQKIFAGDSSQVFHPEEKKRDIIGQIRKLGLIEKELKSKFRTNPELTIAIKKILNQKAKVSGPAQFDHVQLQYFLNDRSAQEFINSKCNGIYNSKIIEFTPYVTKATHSEKMKQHFINSESVHNVIGQEFDDVIVVIDENAYYDSETRKLIYYGGEYYPHLKEEQLYEAMTRVKNNLTVVVINNPDIFIQIQRVLSWKDDVSFERDFDYGKKVGS